jgi:hypothetical protein
MKVIVKWENHKRVYTIGIAHFLKELGIDVDNAKIEKTITKLLEQQEMADASEHQE